MQTKFIQKKISYDGSQLSPLYAYMNHGILGNSIVSWVGPCKVSLEHMKDGEDLLDKSTISGSQMLHFIIEVFHYDLFSGVVCQRLFASIIKDYLQKKSQKALGQDQLLRKGDDIYWKDKKLSISVASRSAVSTQIHFAMNVSTKGTPVKTTSLQELKLNPKAVATDLMKMWKAEFIDMHFATQKVKPLG